MTGALLTGFPVAGDPANGHSSTAAQSFASMGARSASTKAPSTEGRCRDTERTRAEADPSHRRTTMFSRAVEAPPGCSSTHVGRPSADCRASA